MGVGRNGQSVNSLFPRSNDRHLLGQRGEQRNEAINLQPLWQIISSIVATTGARIPRTLRAGSQLLGFLPLFGGLYAGYGRLRNIPVLSKIIKCLGLEDCSNRMDVDRCYRECAPCLFAGKDFECNRDFSPTLRHSFRMGL